MTRTMMIVGLLRLFFVLFLVDDLFKLGRQLEPPEAVLAVWLEMFCNQTMKYTASFCEFS